MKHDSEETFDALKKILAWKQHEQPPPGYFRNFSSSVLAGIRAESSRPASWWQHFLAQFDFKPVLVSASGLAVCVLLFLGVNLAVTDEPSLVFPSLQAAGYTSANPFSGAEPLPITMGFSSSIGVSISTAPVTAGDHRSVFPFAQVQPVRFVPAGQ